MYLAKALITFGNHWQVFEHDEILTFEQRFLSIIISTNRVIFTGNQMVRIRVVMLTTQVIDVINLTDQKNFLKQIFFSHFEIKFCKSWCINYGEWIPLFKKYFFLGQMNVHSIQNVFCLKSLWVFLVWPYYLFQFNSFFLYPIQTEYETSYPQNHGFSSSIFNSQDCILQQNI
jgi:hypothetical protein